MTLQPSLIRTYSALLVVGVLGVLFWLAVGIWHRMQRATLLEDICREGSEQSIDAIRKRAARAQLVMHESAGSIVLSVPAPIPPGTTLCHFRVNGASVYNPELIQD